MSGKGFSKRTRTSGVGDRETRDDEIQIHLTLLDQTKDIILCQVGTRWKELKNRGCIWWFFFV